MNDFVLSNWKYFQIVEFVALKRGTTAVAFFKLAMSHVQPQKW